MHPKTFLLSRIFFFFTYNKEKEKKKEKKKKMTTFNLTHVHFWGVSVTSLVIPSTPLPHFSLILMAVAELQ